MRDEKSKLIKIMNELVRFYLKNGIHHVEMKLDYEKDYGTVSLSGCCAKIEDSVLEDLNQILNSPRKDETEEYYWNLIGSNDFSEMHLLGSLVDCGEVFYDGCNLKINIKRKH